jgi:hypothetical protein
MSNGTPAPLGNHREELFGAEPGSDYVLHWDAFCENSRNYRDMHRDKFLAGYNLLEEHGLRKVGSATGNLKSRDLFFPRTMEKR